MALNHKTYIYDNYKIETDSFGKNLIVNDYSKLNNIAQKIVFQQMVNCPVIELENGEFSLTDEQIFTYWKILKNDFSDYPCEDYFAAMELLPLYSKKTPYIKCEGAFSSNTYNMKVVFCDDITKFGPVNPKSFKQDGFKLLDLDGSVLGSLYPEYYELFFLVDEADRNWQKYSQAQKYNFIDKVKELSGQRKIFLPSFFSDTIIECPEKIKPNIIQMGEDSYKMIVDFGDDDKTKQVNDSLKARLEVDSIYTVREKEKQTKIILSDNQTKIIQDIKETENFTKSQLKDFLENPPENWTDDIIDTSELYSERVIGYGLIEQEKDPILNETIVDWFDGVEPDLPNSDINNQAERMTNNVSKYGLIIKENEFDVDYEEEAKNLKNEFIFPKVDALKLNVILKKYQKEGVAWLFTNFIKKTPGVIFADDMGLGKTIQTLSLIHALDSLFKTKNDKLQVLVVAPLILLDNWIDENEKFFNSSLRFVNANTDKNELLRVLKAAEQKDKRREVIMVSYENLRSRQRDLAKIEWDVIVLDEAQRIKSSTALVSKAAKALKGNFKIALTGTPVENSFLDVWSIADFAIPGFLGSKKDFMSEFEITVEDSDDEIQQKGNKIRDKLGIFFLRRSKEDELEELPEKIIEVKTREMPSEQLRTYKEAQKLVYRIDKTSLGGRLSVLQELKKVSDHPILFSKTDIKRALFEDSAKLIMLEEILDCIKTKNEKVIVFAEYYKSQEIIAKMILSKYGFSPDIVNGQTSVSGFYSRKSLIERFLAKTGFNVIVMSPLAAGVGLTIVGANNVVNFSRHWNPAKEDQAIDRVYRIGQTKTVHVFNLICSAPKFKTFDQNLDRLLSVKRGIKRAALFPSEPPNIQKEMMNYFFED